MARGNFRMKWQKGAAWRITFLALIMCFCIPNHVWAWGKPGHQIVCEIAWQELTAEAKAGIQEFLSNDSAPSFATSCLWADQIRDLPFFEWTKPYHFINLPKGLTYINWQQVCPEPPGCVVSAIRQYFSQLKNPHAARDEKAQALKFLGHFVGDLHQPLHAGRLEDRGGSQIAVTIFGQETSLHKVWDAVILKQTGKSWKQVAKELHDTVTASDRASWRASGPREWTWESYRIAEMQAYKRPAQGWILGKEYVKEHLPILLIRLQKAGIRLANLLNSMQWPVVP
jgi:hypothetical protein